MRTLLNIPDIRTVFGIRDRAVLETLYSCGLRRQEIADLKRQDINLKLQTVLVRSGKELLQSGTGMETIDGLLHCPNVCHETGTIREQEKGSEKGSE